MQRRLMIPKKRFLKISIPIVIIVVASVLIYSAMHRQPPAVAPNASPSTGDNASDPPVQQSFIMSAMGDMLAHDSVVNQAKTAEGYNFVPYFTTITPLLDDSDVVFCNPETPSAGADYGISGYPTFNAPTEFARDLSKIGCDVINLATNHIADKGQRAINTTLEVWEAERLLAVAGANRSTEEQQTVRYFDKNGIKVAFLAFADFSNGPVPHDFSLNSYHDQGLVRQLMTEAREQADAVIVSMHWGTEDSHEVNADQRTTAKLLADLGADVVIGTGPHVLQPVEWVEGVNDQKTLVWYSIGNMLSSQLQLDELTGGVAKFKLTKIDDKIEISDITFTPTFMSYEWSNSDRLAGLLHTRKNLKLQPLKKAQDETKLFDVTVDERLEKIKQWLGSEVSLSIEL